MNLSSIKPQNVIAAAALLAPIALVQSVRLLFGGGPDQASAMQVSGHTPAPALPGGAGTPVASPAPVVTAQQKAAIEHLKVLRGEITIYTSPFNHLVPKAAVQSAPMPVIEQTPGVQQTDTRPAELPSEVRGLSLGALMVNEHGPFAVVSGRVRAVGDVVVPGWTVTAIDIHTRKVSITSDDGVVVTLTQNR